MSNYNFKDNLTIDNNRFLKWFNSSNTRQDIIGLSTSNNLTINDGGGSISLNPSGTSHTFINSGNTGFTLVDNKLGVGYTTTANTNSALTIIKNSFISVNSALGSNDGYLGFSGSSGLSHSAGSSIISYGQNHSTLPGHIQYYTGSSGNHSFFTGVDIKRVEIQNSGTTNFMPNGSTIRLSITNTSSTFDHVVKIVDTTQSTNATTGSLVVSGGLGVLGNTVIDGTLSINSVVGNLQFNSTRPSLSYSSGSITVEGGFGIQSTTDVASVTSGGGLSVAGGFALGKSAIFGGSLVILNSVVSTNSQTGSLVAYGGVGLNKTVHQKAIAPHINLSPLVTGNETSIHFYSNDDFTETSGTSGGWHIGNNALSVGSGNFTIGHASTPRITLRADGTSVFTSTINSTSIITGALQINGGVGIANNLNVGGSIRTGAGQWFGVIDSYSNRNILRYANNESVGGVSFAFEDFVVFSTPGNGNGSSSQYQIGYNSNKCVIVPLLSIRSTIESTSTGSGSLQTLGGAGIAKKLFVGGQIQSTVTTGTAPLVVSSTTNVPNLNASLLGGATFESPGAIGSDTPGSGAFTTLSVSGQITSTVITGTAPLVIASTTNIPNLNASLLGGATFASPGAIGGSTPGSGAFTTLGVSGQITSTVTTGTAPLVIASITNVPNLNASTLSGATFASPGAIGGTVAGSGAFTTLSASGQITSTVTTGTAPLVIASTTNVSNLNASTLSGATFASPGAIGSTVAGTGAFTTLSASGITTVTNTTSVGSSINVTSAVGGALNVSGDLVLLGSKMITLSAGQGGELAPTFTTRSTGTKIVLFPGITGGSVDYAFGIEPNILWNSIPTSSNSFKWYAGTTNIATLDGTGNMSLRQYTSTVTTGTAPFVVASTTNVPNLNASLLGGATFASPGAIGSGTPGTGAFTSLDASSNLTIQGNQIIDTTSTTALTVRKDGADGNVFTVDTTNQRMGLFNGTTNTNDASRGLTIRTNNSSTHIANSDILVGNRTFNIVNDNTTNNSYSSLSLRSNSTGGSLLMDQKLIRTGAGTGKVVFTLTGITTGSTSYDLLELDHNRTITMNGLVSITGTNNATSNTSGGSLTALGGASVLKDMYVGGTFYNSSDIRLKTDIQEIGSVLDKLSNIRSVTYRHDPETAPHQDSSETLYGLLAQEVQAEFPYLVKGENHLSLDYSRFTVILLKAIKELESKNSSLEERLYKLESTTQ